MKAFVTGGAGFIGSHLVPSLLSQQYEVVIFDNFSSGKREFLPKEKNVTVIEGDVLNLSHLSQSMKGSDIVYHFSANADVRKGVNDRSLDLQQGIIATQNVLEAMKEHRIKKIVFPSSMTVYGNPKIERLAENYGPCLPISLYASAKLAAEGLISAYASLFGIQAWIFRFANVIGPRLTHGVIYDLINKLRKDPTLLDVLGDGTQTKPYVYVQDVIDAILFVQNQKNNTEQVAVYNLGVTDTTSVKEIVAMILEKMNLPKIKVNYAKTAYGWVGDVTKCSLDITKLSQLGFTPKYGSKQAVEKTIEAMLEHIIA